MSQRRGRRAGYSVEERRRLLALADELAKAGATKGAIAVELGIHENTLRAWRNERARGRLPVSAQQRRLGSDVAGEVMRVIEAELGPRLDRIERRIVALDRRLGELIRGQADGG